MPWRARQPFDTSTSSAQAGSGQAAQDSGEPQVTWTSRPSLKRKSKVKSKNAKMWS